MWKFDYTVSIKRFHLSKIMFVLIMTLENISTQTPGNVEIKVLVMIVQIGRK